MERPWSLVHDDELRILKKIAQAALELSETGDGINSLHYACEELERDCPRLLEELKRP